jgi:hypothetical protein
MELVFNEPYGSKPPVEDLWGWSGQERTFVELL